MDQTLLLLPLKSKRDALMARQRARQLAALLGYDFQEQACIAAGVFAIAWQMLSLRAPMELCFAVKRETFQVFVQASRKKHAHGELSILRLEKNIPARAKLTSADLAWAIDQLDQLTSRSMFEEVHRLNQELLATMHALTVCQAELLHFKQEKPSAA